MIIEGYKEAAKMDVQIGNLVNYEPSNPLWTGRSLRELQENMKFVRTVKTTLDILEQTINAAMLKRLVEGAERLPG